MSADVWMCLCGCGKPRRECPEFQARMAAWGIPLDELTEKVTVIPLRRKKGRGRGRGTPAR